MIFNLSKNILLTILCFSFFFPAGPSLFAAETIDLGVLQSEWLDIEALPDIKNNEANLRKSSALVEDNKYRRHVLQYRLHQYICKAIVDYKSDNLNIEKKQTSQIMQILFQEAVKVGIEQANARTSFDKLVAQEEGIPLPDPNAADAYDDLNALDLQPQAIAEVERIEESNVLRINSNLVDSTQEPITNQLGSATNLVDGATNLVDSATNLVDSATNSVDSATNLVGSATNLVGSATNLVDGATNLVGSTSNKFSRTQATEDEKIDFKLIPSYPFSKQACSNWLDRSEISWLNIDKSYMAKNTAKDIFTSKQWWLQKVFTNYFFRSNKPADFRASFDQLMTLYSSADQIYPNNPTVVWKSLKELITKIEEQPQISGGINKALIYQAQVDDKRPWYRKVFDSAQGNLLILGIYATGHLLLRKARIVSQKRAAKELEITLSPAALPKKTLKTRLYSFMQKRYQGIRHVYKWSTSKSYRRTNSTKVKDNTTAAKAAADSSAQNPLQKLLEQHKANRAPLPSQNGKEAKAAGSKEVAAKAGATNGTADVAAVGSSSTALVVAGPRVNPEKQINFWKGKYRIGKKALKFSFFTLPKWSLSPIGVYSWLSLDMFYDIWKEFHQHHYPIPQNELDNAQSNIEKRYLKKIHDLFALATDVYRNNENGKLEQSLSYYYAQTLILLGKLAPNESERVVSQVEYNQIQQAAPESPLAQTQNLIVVPADIENNPLLAVSILSLAIERKIVTFLEEIQYLQKARTFGGEMGSVSHSIQKILSDLEEVILALSEHALENARVERQIYEETLANPKKIEAEEEAALKDSAEEIKRQDQDNKDTEKTIEESEKVLPEENTPKVQDKIEVKAFNVDGTVSTVEASAEDAALFGYWAYVIIDGWYEDQEELQNFLDGDELESKNYQKALRFARSNNLQFPQSKKVEKAE